MEEQKINTEANIQLACFVGKYNVDVSNDNNSDNNSDNDNDSDNDSDNDNDNSTINHFLHNIELHEENGCRDCEDCDLEKCYNNNCNNITYGKNSIYCDDCEEEYIVTNKYDNYYIYNEEVKSFIGKNKKQVDMIRSYNECHFYHYCIICGNQKGYLYHSELCSNCFNEYSNDVIACSNDTTNDAANGYNQNADNNEDNASVDDNEDNASADAGFGA